MRCSLYIIRLIEPKTRDHREHWFTKEVATRGPSTPDSINLNHSIDVSFSILRIYPFETPKSDKQTLICWMHSTIPKAKTSTGDFRVVSPIGKRLKETIPFYHPIFSGLNWAYHDRIIVIGKEIRNTLERRWARGPKANTKIL